jgi:hypothetical protein
MKGKWTLLGSILAMLLLALAVGLARAQEPQPPQGSVGIQAALGTAFTYQGQLKKAGSPISDTCDFQFSLWDAAGSGSPPTGGNQIGSTQTGVSVSNGYFTISDLDFGAMPSRAMPAGCRLQSGAPEIPVTPPSRASRSPRHRTPSSAKPPRGAA